MNEKIKIPLPESNIEQLRNFMQSEYYQNLEEKMTGFWKHFGRERVTLDGSNVLIDHNIVKRNRENRLGHDAEFLKNHGLDEGNTQRRIFQCKILLKEIFRTLFYCDHFDLISNTGHLWKGQYDKIQFNDLLQLDVKSWASIKACHFYNRFKPYLNKSINMANPRMIEIGPGSGWQARVIKEHYPNMKFVFIDLPTNVFYTYVNLVKWFPDCTICLPNEQVNNDADFRFIVPDQIDSLPNDYFDFAIQVNGFQEMLPLVISMYFRLLRRIMKENHWFLCCNRTEKWMSVEDTFIRFHDYPWKRSDGIYFLCDDEYFRGRPSCMTKICRLEKY